VIRELEDETKKKIARTFLNDAELRFDVDREQMPRDSVDLIDALPDVPGEHGFKSLPATLQELIDDLPDHNQQMIDAIDAVEPELGAAITSILEDGDDEQRASAFDAVNALFETVKEMLET
jgi:hypothetical protein